MSEIAIASINTFGPSPKADFVPPSEEPVFILNSSQLQDIITRAIQPLQHEIETLKVTVASQNEKIAALEAAQEQDVNRICIDIAYDRQRLAKLERNEPQPLQKDRGEILRALIAANGGKMLAKDARQKMHLSRSGFSLLLSSMKDYIELKPYHLRKNQKVIILR